MSPTPKTSKDLGSFLEALAPELIALAVDAFHLHDGDPVAARRDILDRRAEIARLRALRDAELAAKHGGG